MKNSRYSLLITLFLLSGGLLAYTVARATLLSMTHDESTTFNWFRDMNVLSCFFTIECWHNANNHLLNTWGWQQTVRLLGVSEFSIRLPNLLAHVLYLACSFALVRQVSSRLLVAVAGFLLINANPYLLEFFSLARGYGLYVGLSMASMYAYFRFLQNDRWWALLSSYLLAALAVLANFVALNFLVSLWATVFLVSLFRQGPTPGRIGFDWRRQWRMNAIPLGVSLVLAILLYKPIQFLQEGGEFAFGAERFSDTFYYLVQDSLYGVQYFSDKTVGVFLGLYALAITGSLFGAFWFFFRRPGEQWRQAYLAVALLFLMSCLVMVAQHYILGSNYLLNRKSLLFITLSGMLFFFTLHGIAQYLAPRLPSVIAGFMALFLIYHLFRAGNFQYTREWWYDQNTREMVEYLESKLEPGQEPVRLGVHWVFQPTTVFYLHTRSIDGIVPPPIGDKIHTDGRYAYYYVFDSDIPQLEEKYELERTFQWGRALLRRKQ